MVVLVQFSFQDGLVPVPPFKGFSLRWYDKMFADRKLMEALGNSVAGRRAVVAWRRRRSASSPPSELARRPAARAPQMQFLLMAPITVSYIIIALGLLIVFNGLGIGKSLFAVGVGHVVINLPLCFAVIYSQMGEHQANVERAALDLGASEFKALVYVTVPMLWPALLAAFFIAFTLSWDEFVIAQLLSKFDVTLPVVIFSLLRTGLNPRDQRGRHLRVRDLHRPGRSGRSCCWRGDGAMAEPLVRLRGVSQELRELPSPSRRSTWTSPPANSSSCWARPAAARRPSCR